MAEQAIAEIRRMNRTRAIEELDPYKIAALRAVDQGSAEALASVNAFTLDVLGRMELLHRPKGRHSKTDWRLTEEGRAALAFHTRPLHTDGHK